LNDFWSRPTIGPTIGLGEVAVLPGPRKRPFFYPIFEPDHTHFRAKKLGRNKKRAASASGFAAVDAFLYPAHRAEYNMSIPLTRRLFGDWRFQGFA
jgi:hypothetical protein